MVLVFFMKFSFMGLFFWFVVFSFEKSWIDFFVEMFFLMVICFY